jgi:hypothetical protein
MMNRLKLILAGLLVSTLVYPQSNPGGPAYVPTQIVAGSNVTISPTSGLGKVTINATGGGSGSVTNVATGTGLTGGPISTTGTISLAPIAAGTILGNSTGSTAAPGAQPALPQANLFFAQAYGQTGFGTTPCTWTSTGDVGPCINSAIAAAAAAGGGTVVVPATGNTSITSCFGVATPIVQANSGVHLAGAGVGPSRDTVNSTWFNAYTRLCWNGAAGTNTLLFVGQSGGGSALSVHSADVVGIVADCGNGVATNPCTIAMHFQQVSHSRIDVGVSEATSQGLLFDTNLSSDAPGSQDNDIWINCRELATGNTASCITFDKQTSSTKNFSYNRIWYLNAWYTNGDGFDFCANDNNIIEEIRASPNPSGTPTGRPVVIANDTYVPPNGVACNAKAGKLDDQFFHIGTQIVVLGSATGATVTPTVGSNTPNTFILATTGATYTPGSPINSLPFASTTGVAAGEVINCAGGYSSGVPPNDPVVSIVANTSVKLLYPIVSTVGSINCTFSFGITYNAAPGSYSLVATGPTTFTLTAPAGGHTQSGISISGNLLTFTDMVLPLTGSATSDAYTIVVPTAALNVNIIGVDQSNNVPLPFFENGATGQFGYTTTPIAFATNTNATTICNWQVNPCSTSTGLNAIALGSGAANGQNAITLGGNGQTSSGLSSTTMGGSTVASGNFSLAMGNASTASGVNGLAGGNGGIDRGRYSGNCWSGKPIGTAGDELACEQVLSGQAAATNGSTKVLTADGAAIGTANCVNIPVSTVAALNIDVAATAHPVGASVTAIVWPAWTGIVSRASGGTTTVTMNSLPTPLSVGTVTGATVAAVGAANGCVQITFTSPSTNAILWNAVATVRSTEVQ